MGVDELERHILQLIGNALCENCESGDCMKCNRLNKYEKSTKRLLTKLSKDVILNS